MERDTKHPQGNSKHVPYKLASKQFMDFPDSFLYREHALIYIIIIETCFVRVVHP